MRRCLVLGGGGFFGAFQAGAYESLDSFDAVIGASAGALNAWAIASRMPPAQLQDLWLSAAASVRTGFRRPRYFGDGILDSSRLESMVHTLTRDWRPVIDLTIVVSQGWRCRQVLVRNQDITAGVLLASCAVPVLLPAKTVGGTLSFDGGIRDSCPIWAAVELGATHITGINVWTHLPWWYPSSWRQGKKVSEKRRLQATLLIEPPHALGPLRLAATAAPSDVAAWIELGRRTAASVFARQ
ncbi:MAG TPA: patatin-like phospholipase family protein [Bryobacteraceae bacterium]|nr:patatin-like phospholipase family protein [Bryobacteraceae bacterium]